MRIAIAWFPASEYEQALAAWPDLAEEWADSAHDGYCRRMESKMRDLTAHGILISGVAPILVDDYLAWCAEHDKDPGQGDSRASFAANLGRAGETIPWPPRRNAPCWCGSDLKYKLCCGSVPRAAP